VDSHLGTATPTEAVQQLRVQGQYDLADQLERDLHAADEQLERDLAEVEQTDRRLKRRERQHNAADQRHLRQLASAEWHAQRRGLPRMIATRRLDRRLGCGRPAARRTAAASRDGPSGSDPDLGDEPSGHRPPLSEQAVAS
jgi:hypothetical protein